MKKILFTVLIAAVFTVSSFAQVLPNPECFAEAPTEAAAIAAVQSQGCIVEYTVDKDTFWQAFGYPCNDKEPCLVNAFLS